MANAPPTISEVTFWPLPVSDKGLLGISSVLFDNKLCLNSISVYSTLDGNIRLLFPNTTLKNGRVVNVYYPIDRQTYESIREAIAQKIEEVHDKVKGNTNASNIF